ncbi:Ger(x)C family spore germination protein [Haloimpatiens sp. FM7315]|uniref:Ger(x)C family spore germination protein n=1 Tax=Haloimpatiens sp. FM7315 TaxID=3298609 RepID=UPI00370B586C
MIKKIKIIIIIFIFSFTLCGCWDYQDIDKRSIVISLGVDRVKDQIEFSTEVAKLADKSGESNEVYTDVSKGSNFEEARRDFNAKRPYSTFLGATRIVVFGQEYAKEGIEPYLNRINRIYDYRKTLLGVVSKDTPIKLFKKKAKNDLSIGFLLEHSINSLSGEGIAIYTDIGDMMSDISFGDIGYMLPYVGVEDDSVKYLGIAIMKDSKLIAVVDKNDTAGILYLSGKNPKLMEVITDELGENNSISFKTRIRKKKINTYYENNKVSINIDLELDAELQYLYYIMRITPSESEKLEKLVSNQVERQIFTIVKKTQEDYKCDIFGFAKYFKSQHFKEYKNINWQKEYPNIEINVDVKTKIVNKNLQDLNVKEKYR